jgi:hypothetical protein
VSRSGSVYRVILLSLMATCIISSGSFGQASQRAASVVVNGRSGQADTVMLNDRQFIDIQALARIAQGSVTFQGRRIVLTLPAGQGDGALEPAAPEPAAPKPTDSSHLSQEFVKAGIEELALMREWASPLAYAIQNGYPITQQAVSQYQAQAANGLRLAQAAAKTDADQSAFQLLSNEFSAIEQWSNKLIQARQSMDTANYAMSHGALRDDPQSQKIIACGHFLGSMLGSGTFQDDGSCH